MNLRLFAALLASVVLITGQTKKILVLGQNDDVVRDWQTASAKVKLVRVTNETVMSEIADAHALIGSIKPQWVRAGKNLEWTQMMSAGVEKVLHLSGSNDLRDSDIVLTNNQVVQGPEIADHAMAMLLALTREIPKWLKLQGEQRWQRRPRNLFELNTKTAVVI